MLLTFFRSGGLCLFFVCFFVFLTITPWDSVNCVVSNRGGEAASTSHPPLSLLFVTGAQTGSRCRRPIRIGLRRMMPMTHQNSGAEGGGSCGRGRDGRRKWRGGAPTNLRLASSISPLQSLSWLCQSSRRLREKALIKTFVRSQSHWAGLIKPLFQMLPAAVNAPAPRGRRASRWEGDFSWGCQTQFKKLFH